MAMPQTNIHRSDQYKAYGARSSGRHANRKIVLTLFAVVLVAGLVYGGLQYMKAQDDIKRLQNPREAAKQELVELNKTVGSLAVVPGNETPALATVADPSKLEGQTFFKNAQKGDKVLVYKKAGRAVLYRPSSNKIVEIAPIAENTPSSSVTETPPSTSD